jgi:putative iron-regulated protein
MKKIFIPAMLVAMLCSGCTKEKDNGTTTDFNALKDAAISDFVNKIALPGYADLKIKAETLNDAVVSLNNNTNEINLEASKAAWKDMRSTWEKCEGYLFGPVEDSEYDPETDTWPVNFNDLNALLASNQPLGVSDIEALSSRALKGYHPIEYILWGVSGNRTASTLTAREKEYIVSLSVHLETQATLLYNSWHPDAGNYAAVFLNAGKGSTVYPKKQDAFISITDGLLAICEEVAEGKMKEPYDAAAINPAAGAQIVESPFSGNSATDFLNNIRGAYQVYQGKFNEDGNGLEDLVKAKNSSLDLELQQKFNAAIGSFNAITLPYEDAIASQRIQCLNCMNAINDLAAAIENKLKPFVIQTITD